MNGDEKGTSRTYFNQRMGAPEVWQVGSGTVCVYSSRSPAKETANEDAAAVITVGANSAVLMVADGLGGSPAGEQAARLAVEALQNTLQTAHEGDSLLRTSIITGFERANEAVQSLGVGAATTLAVVEVNDGVARPYYVGDSIILVVGGRGESNCRPFPIPRSAMAWKRD